MPKAPSSSKTRAATPAPPRYESGMVERVSAEDAKAAAKELTPYLRKRFAEAKADDEVDADLTPEALAELLKAGR